MNRLDESGVYDGSRVFSFMVEPLGLSVDQVNKTNQQTFFFCKIKLIVFFYIQINFLFSQFSAVIAAFAFRHHLHNNKVAPETRHGAAMLLGLVMVVFCFGRYVQTASSFFIHFINIHNVLFCLLHMAKYRQALHLACLSSISYAILLTASPKISHK